jgi:cell wall-associated NlpC family hydrolase
MFTKFMKPLLSLGLSFTIAFSAVSAAALLPAPVSEAATTTADRIISLGERYLGTPYKFGAKSGVTYQFDCSSFTQYIFKKNGIILPRVSRDQAKKGKYVSKRYLKKGDLVFFSTPSSRGKIGHVGVYAGNGNFLHTYKKGVGVTYSKLNSSWWSKSYITARRVL